MKLPSRVAWLFLGFVAFLTGCGEGPGKYVEFGQTAPSKLEENQTAPSGLASESDPAGNSSTDANATPPTTPTASKENSDTNKAAAAGQPIESTPESPSVENGAVPPNEAGTVAPVEIAKNGDAAAGKMPERGLVTSSQSGLQGPADMPIVENSAVSEPRKIELLIPELRLRKERGTEAVRVTYDDVDLLKVLNMEPVPVDAVEFFPEWLKSLDGKLIRIRGFMYPTFEATGLTSFTLARDNGICCFVRQPKIYDIIGVTLAAGVSTDYIEGRPFDVEGIFRIVPQSDEKDLSRLYSIDNAKVLH